MKLKTLNQAVLATMLTTTSAYAHSHGEEASKFSFSGLVEVSVSQSENNPVDLAIDTVQLTFGAQLAENIDAEVVVLDENLGVRSHTGAAVDSAVINMSTEMGVITAGKMYAPFTSGETNMVTDAVTLEEPGAAGIAFANNAGNLGYKVYVMTPDNDYTQTGDNTFGELSGLNLNYTFNQYSNISADVVSVDGNASTALAYAGEAGGLGFIAQYTNMYNQAEPRTNIEVSYAVGYGKFAIAKQSDASNKDIWLYGFSADLRKDLAANIEYKENLNDKETTFTAQLAYNF